MLPNPNLKIVPNRVKKLPDELDREVMDTFLCIWLFRETAALEIYEKKNIWNLYESFLDVSKNENGVFTKKCRKIKVSNFCVQ